MKKKFETSRVDSDAKKRYFGDPAALRKREDGEADLRADRTIVKISISLLKLDFLPTSNVSMGVELIGRASGTQALVIQAGMFLADKNY